MKKMLCLGISLLCVFSLVACGGKTSSKTKLKVGIVQIVEHKSLDTIRESLLKELEDKGYDEDEIEIIYKNAGGDTSLLNTICQQFKEDDVDAIVAIATPSAQAAANFSSDIPVIFSAVSDPVGANLVDNLEKPNNNITGTSDEIQVDKIMDLALEMYPDTKTVGFLYNSGEANSASNLKKLEKYAKEHDLTINKGPISSTADIQARTQNLLDTSDIVFAPNDNSIASSMDIVSSLAISAKKPLFVGADSMVSDKGFATVGINYDTLGKETATILIDVLKGKDVKDIPVKVFKDDLSVYINEDTAKAIGFDAMETIKSTHKNIIFLKNE